MEMHKWKDAIGCMNNADIEKKVNDSIVVDVCIICQKLRHVELI